LVRFHSILCRTALAFTLVASLGTLAAEQFETRSVTPAGRAPFSVAVGDFDRDGNKDVAVADFYGPYVTVLLGKGDGTFRSTATYAAGNTPETVVAVDLNRDGVLDLVAADSTRAALYVLIGNGDGTFQAATSVGLTSNPTSLAVGDLNGDHIPDVVVGGIGVSVLLGKGDGTFHAPIDSKVLTGYVPAVAVGDFDGDGKLDVVALSRDAIVLMGNGDGTLRLGEHFPVLGGMESVVVADFRGIGRFDIAIGGLGLSIGVVLGNGDGTFRPPVYYTAPDPLEIVAVDVNGDGKPDLVAASESILDRLILPAGVSVLFGNGDGSFQPVQSYAAAQFTRAAAAADMNGDQQVDLIGSDWVHDNVTVLLNTGVVTFSPTTPVNFPFQLVGTSSREQDVTLTNTGTTALTISSVTVRGPFASNGNCKGSIASGASCVFHVRFSPVVKGATSGTITIVDSASSKPQVVDLTGAGTFLDFSPPGLIFPPQEVGTESLPQTVTLTNTGSTQLRISQLLIHGDYQNFGEANTCGRSVDPGGSCTITVKFRPTVTGLRKAYIEITDDGGGSPQRVMLAGTGD
jgi:archaellum component FlaF (FlaF/FlaG flagellin family)